MKVIKKELTAVFMALVMVCTVLPMTVQAADDFDAFAVTASLQSGTELAGESAVFHITVKNKTTETLTLTTFNTLSYGVDEEGETWGTLTDSSGAEVTDENLDKIVFASGEQKEYTLSGTMPDSWNAKSTLTIVVIGARGTNQNDTYFGQYDYQATVAKQGDTEKTETEKADVEQTVKGTTITKLTAAKKKITITWKKQTSGTDGYQIQYSLNKKFSSAKTVKIAGGKKTSYTIKSLKSGKKYYVRIRTYQKQKRGTVYSSWSNTKSIKVR